MKPEDEFILRQNSNNREIIYYLIDVIYAEVKEVDLLFKYGIPYFYYNDKPFCYIAPSKKGYVDLGFARGFQLKRNLFFLNGENRNTVKSLRYFELDSIEDIILRDVIKESLTLY